MAINNILDRSLLSLSRNGVLHKVNCACNSFRPTKQQAYDAFEREGMGIAIFEVVFIHGIQVLTECGNLYQYDGSHVGGEYFFLVTGQSAKKKIWNLIKMQLRSSY